MARHKLALATIIRRDSLLLFTLFVLVYGNLIRLQVSALLDTKLATTVYAAENKATSPTASVVPVENDADPARTAQTNQTASSPAAVLRGTIEVPRTCTGSPYLYPTALSLGDSLGGLNSVIDSPAYYQVYGSSVSSLRSSIQNCPLRAAAGAYHAITAYHLNWSYTPVATNGACTITNVKVGLRVNQFMPTYTPNAATPESVTAAWNTYATNLKTHEDGHTAINIDYAERLTHALQSMGALDCGSLTSQVKNTIDSYIVMLDTANELYDSQTNHGATQGAVL